MKKIFPWLLLLVALFFYPPAFAPLGGGKFIALYLSGLISAVYLWRGPLALPKLGRNYAGALGLLAVLSLAQLFYFRGTGVVFVLADRLSFLFLLLGFWKAFREGLNLAEFWLPAVLGAFFVSVLALAGVGDAQGGLLGGAWPAADGVMLFLLLAWSSPAPVRAWPSIAQMFFALSNALGFYVIATRAGSLGLVAAALAAFVLYSRSRLKGFGNARAGLIGLSLGIALALTSVSLGRATLASNMPADWRYALWRAAGAMIAALPSGAGAGSFPFAALPFLKREGLAREGAFFYSPASELLRFSAEEGVLLALAFLATWIFLAYRWRKAGARETAYVGATLVYLAATALVGSPFLSPLPLAFLALLGGLMASTAFEAQTPERAKLGALAVASVALFTLTTTATLSRTLEDQPALSHVACALTPENWRACQRAARHVEETEGPNHARPLVEAMLVREPLNFSATKQLAFIAGQQRRSLEACFLLWRYDDFYGGKSTQHETLLKNCQKKWLDYFERKRPTRYYEKSAATPTGF